jgi:hypothetical protein
MSRQTMWEETTMARVKRLIVATLLGAVSGLFCYSAAILLLGLEIPFLCLTSLSARNGMLSALHL